MMSSSPQLPEQEHQQLEQLALLYAMADHIQRARHLDHIYEEAVEGLRRALGADRSALLISNETGGMTFRAWAGVSERCREALEGHNPWPPGTRDPRPIVVEDLEVAEALGPSRMVVLEEGVRSMAFIPLLHRGRLLGNFMISHDQPRAFESAELRLGEAIAGHLAFAIWRSRSDADQAELLRRFEAERSVLESVVKQMPAGVLLADVPSGRIVMSNQLVSEIWQRPFRHASGIADYAGWGGIAPDGVRLAPAEWPLARTVLRGETVRGEEVVIERGDGSRGVIRMSSTPVQDTRGRPLAAVAVVYDVTEEKAAEENRAFLEDGTRLLNASLELDRTLESLGRIVVGRQADWCVVYRVTEAGAIQQVALDHVDASRSSDAGVFGEATMHLDDDSLLAWSVREGTPVLGPELTSGALRLLQGGDDRGRSIARELGGDSFMILPLLSRDRPVGALAMVRSLRYDEKDLELMTELGRRAGLAMDNALLYEKARAADQAKANFLAVMSHEFRTPLSAILGYADILTAEVHGALNQKQAGHLERVKASVRHLSHLVDEILSYASMEAGRERLRVERVNVCALAMDVAAIMEPIAEASGLDLRVRTPEQPVEISTDTSKLRQILINLLSNAVKYTPKGYVELTVELEDSRVLCSVVDTGPGIAREHMQSVFEPFWQVERGDGRRIAGTGLGLAVARRLARLMGGDVTVTSEVGSGSTFSLELPVEAVASPPRA